MFSLLTFAALMDDSIPVAVQVRISKPRSRLVICRILRLLCTVETILNRWIRTDCMCAHQVLRCYLTRAGCRNRRHSRHTVETTIAQSGRLRRHFSRGGKEGCRDRDIRKLSAKPRFSVPSQAYRFGRYNLNDSAWMRGAVVDRRRRYAYLLMAP